MKNDFISIYSSLKTKEQKQFNKYVECFYGNQKSVILVFEEVAAASTEVDFEAIRQASFDNKNRLNAFADLKKWVLEFLGLQELRSNGTEAKLLGLEALRKRGLYDAYQQRSKQITDELNKQQTPDLWHSFWKVRLSHINYFHLPLDLLQDFKPDLTSLMSELDNFYIAAKLKYSAEFSTRSTVVNEEYNTILLEPILDLLKSGAPVSPLVNDLYYTLFQLIKEHSFEAFSKLKQFLFENPQFDIFERTALLLYLLNFTVSRLRAGDYSYVQESFSLYKMGIEESFFMTSGYFPTITFLNIVNIACRLEEYEWVNEFVDKWSPSLMPTEKEEVTSFTKARIYFEEKKFDKVVELLEDVSYKNLNFALNVRLLLIRAYYEGQNLEAALDSCNALNLFLYRNNKIGKPLRANVNNFIKIFRLLALDKPKEQLIIEMDKTQKSTMCYDWLLAKIEELKR